ncbi:MAG: LVIVD repeat-containing protein [Actinomycetota bacterium]
MRRSFSLLAAAWLAVVPLSIAPAQAEPGAPCAPPAVPDPMPEGQSHDHTDAAQHGFACRVRTLASLDLRGAIPEPMLFGEIDAAGTTVAMATAFPQAGFVLLDVSDPARPALLSRYRDARCETRSDLDCGADVKLTPDGRFAFLALQRAARGDPDESKRLQPGIVTVDVSDPRTPRRVSFAPLRPVGVHMLAYHQIRGEGFVFARARGLGPRADEPGVAIFRVGRDGGLSRIGTIVVDAAHDVSLYDDPIDRTTYLSLSGAQSGHLYFFDVGDPANPKEAGRFSPRAEVRDNSWYMHNAWEFREGARRLAFAGPELYGEVGSLPPGHGSVAGPLWLLDTTSHARPHVLGEWRNPGRHAAGTLTFSPHNTWYAGDGITWTAHYHGGVWVLDWREVLAGRARRPREIGYAVPNALRRDFVAS